MRHRHRQHGEDDVRPIRNRLARIVAIAAVLLTLSIASSSPALGWGGDIADMFDGANSIDDGGVPQPN